MVNLRRLARKMGVKLNHRDLEGVMATLQVARRLVQDEGFAPSEALLRAADEFAAPIDSGRAFWAAHYALTTAGVSHGFSLFSLDYVGVDEVLPVFDTAIKNQGEFNAKAGKR